MFDNGPTIDRSMQQSSYIFKNFSYGGKIEETSLPLGYIRIMNLFW